MTWEMGLRKEMLPNINCVSRLSRVHVTAEYSGNTAIQAHCKYCFASQSISAVRKGHWNGTYLLSFCLKVDKAHFIFFSHPRCSPAWSPVLPAIGSCLHPLWFLKGKTKNLTILYDDSSDRWRKLAPKKPKYCKCLKEESTNQREVLAGP